MTTQNKIAAAVMDAIKSRDHRSLKAMGIITREKSIPAEYYTPRFSVTVAMIRALGLDEHKVSKNLRGRLGRSDGKLYFSDISECVGFCIKISYMINENEGAVDYLESVGIL